MDRELIYAMVANVIKEYHLDFEKMLLIAVCLLREANALGPNTILPKVVCQLEDLIR